MKKLLAILMLISFSCYGDAPKEAPAKPQQEITLEHLYILKGQYITQIEVIQSQLQEVNKLLLEKINSAQSNNAKVKS